MSAPRAIAQQDPAQCTEFAGQFDQIATGEARPIAELLQRVPRECEALRERMSQRLRSLSTAPSRSATEAAPPPPAATTAPAAETVEAAPAPTTAPAEPTLEAQFLAGEATFNKPTEMRVGGSAIVEVQVNLAAQEAPTQMGDAGETVTRQIQITREVQARLSSADFDIEPVSGLDGVVAITEHSVGQWAWRVTPRRASENARLVLQIYGRVRLPDDTQSFALIKTYEEYITVKVTPQDMWEMSLDFLRLNWPMVSGIVGAIFAGLLLLFRSRRARSQE